MFNEKYASVLNEYENFWERKNTERCILNLSYTKSKTTPYRRFTSLEERWLDEEYVYGGFKNRLGNTGYMAEGIPMLFTNLGPGCLAACIGGNYGLAPRTIWFDQNPVIADWENAPLLEFNESSEMWQHITRLQSRFAKDKDVHFSITDLGGILDIVASLRSTETLLYDLYDYPEEVKKCTENVLKLWYKAFDRQLETIKGTGQPFNNWMNIPSSKPWYPIQCDFSYMISPAQFEEFVLPHLADQAKNIERTIYHLDGKGELPHVDMLLDIPELNGIQWISGDGEAPLYDEKWFGLYKKIQDKKKNIVLLGGLNERDLAGAERLIKSIDPTGVYISVHCSTEDKAKDLLEKVTRWSE